MCARLGEFTVKQVGAELAVSRVVAAAHVSKLKRAGVIVAVAHGHYRMVTMSAESPAAATRAAMGPRLPARRGSSAERPCRRRSRSDKGAADPGTATDAVALAMIELERRRGAIDAAIDALRAV